ncbi:6-phosphogluconolactonase [Mucilaginibacter sp. JRF]|uniref:6-phosphogluconolactonase n=1 Tax=Mucilaginibacter sp. JRF TaxID=2780088 RepID=UPI0018811739|nr:6-phosphogluconolactonase [Mucilaginibacter sp. JRF]MBE9584049.1 6-phosphogluconolactonase [Mucilaginibacter sp. JRF]
MISIFKDNVELCTALADLFISTGTSAIAKNGRFTVALTGGSSPVALHKILAQPEYQEQLDWSKVFVFWGDERWVPLTDEKSNAKMAFETLLNHVPIPKQNIFPMWSDDKDAKAYAADYEQILRGFFGEDEANFDLLILGMGDDGHTASLFPHTEVLHERTKWVDAYYLEPQQMYRITLTEPFINKAQKVAVLVFGANKAPALHEVLEGERNFEQYPSQLLNPASGKLMWMVDEGAASKLSDEAKASK